MADETPDLRSGLPATPPGDQPGEPGPQIGHDEWVARAGERIQTQRMKEQFGRVHWVVWFAIAITVLAFVPVITTDGYIIRVGADTLIYALLALGLNVAVGWAGLLDLAYVAFFGFGAYSYALVSSDKFGQHWPTYAVLPAIAVATGFVGLVLGLSSWRLAGDYLAIVTLFFAQIFTVVLLNGDKISLLGGVFGVDGSADITGGPNGIANLDSFHIGSHQASSVSSYYWIALVMAAVVFFFFVLLDDSRPGRAWRSLREDNLAAEAMGVPVDRMKLFAFGLGASVAGLTGTVFAALNLGVYPQTFDIPLLITIYSMVILGGAGSLVGVVLGAAAINIPLEALRPDTSLSSWTSDGRWLFYGVVIATIFAKVRPWKWAFGIVGGTIALGFAVRTIFEAAWPATVHGPLLSSSTGQVPSGVMAGFIRHYVLLPTSGETFGRWAFVALMLSVCILVVVPWRREVKYCCLPFVIYLAALAWENLLVPESTTTRLMLLGALLVVLMIERPQGLLGKQRVEVV
jgi:ABC-type branched-subunit amino acid transport system permease subunit